MKREEIIIEEGKLTILLGIFGTKTYDYFNKRTEAMGWAYFRGICPDTEGHDVMHTVKEVTTIADKIIFVLDDVQFPINTSMSITCEELELICNDPQLFEKTIFVRGHEVINFDKNLVLTT